MISVQPLAGGGTAAGYYLQREAGCDLERSGPDGRLGYYLDGPEPIGRWLGGGAEALGLTGPLTPTGATLLRELLEGRGLDGQRLLPPVYRYTQDGSRVDVRRCGFDVTLSSPKSVSVLMGLADPAIAAQVQLAHQSAVTDAIGLLEQLTARAARGHQGDGRRATRIRTSGLIAAGFEHHTSRTSDPQLHTHVVIANLACGVDGRWSALDSRTLHRQATTASYLYQARLRAELTSRLGVTWGEVDNGVAEINGISLPLRRAFSTRRVHIEAELNRTGRAGPKAARVACLTTRSAKQHTAPATLRERWWATARRFDFHPRDLPRLLWRGRAPRGVDLLALTRAVLGPEGVTRDSSTFEQGTLVRQICQHLPVGVDLSARQILRLAQQLAQHPDVLPVLTDTGRAYTTLELVTTEQQALERVSQRQHDGLAQVPNAIGTERLRPDQQVMVRALLTSGRGVDVVAGEAGSGKTAALGAATRAWTDAGIEVRGTAVAALTAQGLQEATGAQAVSLARLVQHPERHLPTGGVLLLDEAGMVGTRSLTRLLILTEQQRCKLVLVGDPGQLPELEAGGLFATLARRPEALKLTGHHRQHEPWEGQALTDLRNGRTDDALNAYKQHDRLHTSDNRTKLLGQLVDDYATHRAAADQPSDVLVLAQSRRDLQLLNTLIRYRLRIDGLLGAQAIVVTTPGGPVEYRTGEQVIVTRNDHQRALLNGHTGTVTKADTNGLTLRLRDGRDITLDRAWLTAGTLAYGYALTLHKAQGRTVQTALLWGDRSLYQEAGYVGLSRGRAANHLYLAPSHDHNDDLGCWPHPRPRRDLFDERSRGLAASRAHELALNQLNRDTGRGRSR